MWYAMFLTTICAAGFLQSSGSRFYVDFEHPNITYWNPKYYAYINLTAQRYNRRDSVHYVSIHSETLVEFGNNILVDAYIYEFLSNEYRRSFIEAHYRLCDAIQKEKYFMPLVIEFFPYKTCPFPKGVYHHVNMSFPDMPLLGTFPFRTGRVFANASNYSTGERVLSVYIDAVIKEKTQRGK